MPEQTVSDLGALTKKQYPGKYDDMSDAELGYRVKQKDPTKYAKYSDSTFDKMTSVKAALNKKSIESGPGKKQFDQAMASANKDIADHMEKVEDSVKMAMFTAAAPLTAGMGAVAGFATMAGVGVDAVFSINALRQATGLGNVPKDVHELAIALGGGALEGIETELGGRGTAAVLKGVVNQIPKILTNAAARAANRAGLLKQLSGQVTDQLGEKLGVTGGPRVLASIGNAWNYAMEGFEKLPKASKEAMEVLQKFRGQDELRIAGTGLAEKQPVMALIEKNAELVKALRDKAGELGEKEFKILQKTSDALDLSIRTAIRQIPGASELYKQGQHIAELEGKKLVSSKLANVMLLKMVSRFGLGVGVKAGEVAHNLVGATLQRVMSSNTSATAFAEAVKKYTSRLPEAARSLTGEAFERAGISALVKDYLGWQEQVAYPEGPEEK